jgi:predicted phosphoribosyltransferase
MFLNREEAGNKLTEKLIDYNNHKNAVIVAIPRGGVPIGYVIAKKLNLPLEIVLSKKIVHPFHKEYAIGAVTLKNRILSDVAAEVSKVYIDDETAQVRELLRQRHTWYYGHKAPLKLKDRTVIIVDDGVATGSTLISSIHFIQDEQPSEIIVALPVAPSSALKKITALPSVTNTICLLIPENFRAVGQFYKEFDQVDDQEVIQLLKEATNNLS